MALMIPLALIAFILFIFGKIFRRTRGNSFDMYFDWVSSYFVLMLFSTIALIILGMVVSVLCFYLIGMKIKISGEDYILFSYVFGGIVNLKILHKITKGFSEETDMDRLPKRIWF